MTVYRISYLFCIFDFTKAKKIVLTIYRFLASVICEFLYLFSDKNMLFDRNKLAKKFIYEIYRLGNN